MRSLPKSVAILGLSLSLIIVQGCAAHSRHAAVPSGLAAKAIVSGMDYGIRYFPENPDRVQVFIDDYGKTMELEDAYYAKQGHSGSLPSIAMLAISGGGDNGAFAAGFLNGWTKAGTRPEFKLVTGVSTGALVAPFAFLGPAYDKKLKEFYTSISLKDIAKKRSILAVVTNDAMADNTPLKKLVKKNIDQGMLDAIAVEHGKGRMLLIGTVDLDARQPVIWNITKIAASGRPGSLELVRSLLIASSAIPATFPPVMIDVEVGGKKYQEMHVDGNTAAQVFIYPTAVRLKDLSEIAGVNRERKLYILRNARLDPEWAQVERRTLPIAAQAIGTLIQSQGVGDLYRIYTVTRRDGIDFNLAFIPPNFVTPHKEEFDPVYMRALYGVGYELAEKGYSWTKEPPVLIPTSE
ncbi:patatin-like phospholipase family protein [Edaphobacter sp. HDX4]|uniref:patatin-like phospholipase family protein n=1 Tax=Edaphobacter sp. HDX4 TaxID=2794064 RepID=UPI002FE5D5E2